MAFPGVKPDHVFTPRAADINPTLYIPRPELESELEESLSESQHIVIFGESGNGKSWLYKSVFKKTGTYYEVVNLVQASRLGSLSAAFKDKIDRLEDVRKSEYEKRQAAKFSPGGLGGEIEGQWKYKLGKKESFEDLLAYMSKRKFVKNRIIVLDNFEQIADDYDVCRQVANCVILLDDPVYSRYGVKLCIVGVPSGVDDILSQHGNIQTISSRLKEIPEV